MLMVQSENKTVLNWKKNVRANENDDNHDRSDNFKDVGDGDSDGDGDGDGDDDDDDDDDGCDDTTFLHRQDFLQI